MAVFKKDKYKVVEIVYGKEMVEHGFENYKAANNARKTILNNGHGATLYKRDNKIYGGWSKRGSWIPGSQINTTGLSKRSIRKLGL
jgi:hypothetical protein